MTEQIVYAIVGGPLQDGMLSGLTVYRATRTTHPEDIRPEVRYTSTVETQDSTVWIQEYRAGTRWNHDTHYTIPESQIFLSFEEALASAKSHLQRVIANNQRILDDFGPAPKDDPPGPTAAERLRDA